MWVGHVGSLRKNTCLRHFGDALDHQLVGRHGRVGREWQAEYGGHDHLLDELLPKRHGAVLLVVRVGEPPARTNKEEGLEQDYIAMDNSSLVLGFVTYSAEQISI